MNKKLYPVIAGVLALTLAVTMWFVLKPSPGAVPEDSPHNAPSENSAVQVPGGNARDYNPNIISQDPVKPEPLTPFRPPRNVFRIEVSGRVLNDAGMAVPDATVRFVGEAGLAGVTGAGFTDALGRYRLVAWSDRLAGTGGKARVQADDNAGGWGVTDLVDLAADSQVAMPDVVIPAAVEIRGQVRDADGVPVTGAMITARSDIPYEMIPRGQRNEQVQHRYIINAATTDDRGGFRIGGLRAGKYRVDVDRSYFGTQTDSTYLEAVVGGTNWAEMTVSARDFLRGVLRDSDGQPVVGAVVRAAGTELMALGGPRIAQTRDDRETFRDGNRPIDRRAGQQNSPRGPVLSCLTDYLGRFGFFSLAHGKWELSAMLGDSTAKLEGLALNQADHVLTVEVGATVSGIVRSAEDSRPVEFFDLRAASIGERATVFERADPNRAYPLRPMGEFRLVNPAEGQNFRVSAPGFAPAPVPAGALGPGERRTGVEIKLAPLCELTLVLTANGARLEVEPLVLLMQRGVVAHSTSDAMGEARFFSLPPGRYSVVAILGDGSRVGTEFGAPARARARVELALSPMTDP